MGHIKNGINVAFRKSNNMFNYSIQELSIYNYVYTKAYEKIGLYITTSIATASYKGAPGPILSSSLSGSFISSSGYIQTTTDRSYNPSVYDSSSADVLSLTEYVVNTVTTNSLESMAIRYNYPDWRVQGMFTGSLTLGQEQMLEELVYELILDYQGNRDAPADRFTNYGL
jgi:hypothetical protein